MHLLTGCACLVQGPVGVSNKHVETAIDEGSGKLTMLYQVSTISIQIQTSTVQDQLCNECPVLLEQIPG